MATKKGVLGGGHLEQLRTEVDVCHSHSKVCMTDEYLYLPFGEDNFINKRGNNYDADISYCGDFDDANPK